MRRNASGSACENGICFVLVIWQGNKSSDTRRNHVCPRRVRLYWRLIKLMRVRVCKLEISGVEAHLRIMHALAVRLHPHGHVLQRPSAARIQLALRRERNVDHVVAAPRHGFEQGVDNLQRRLRPASSHSKRAQVRGRPCARSRARKQASSTSWLTSGDFRLPADCAGDYQHGAQARRVLLSGYSGDHEIRQQILPIESCGLDRRRDLLSCREGDRILWPVRQTSGDHEIRYATIPINKASVVLSCRRDDCSLCTKV